MELKNPTQELFPSMMQNTRLLILDYDVTRYHSFDMFRYMLMDRTWFDRCDPSFRDPFVQDRTVEKQVLRYMRTCSHINPFDNFKDVDNSKNYHRVLEMEDKMNEIFSEKLLLTTETDIAARLGIIFERKSITGYWLKYKNDPHQLPFQNELTVYTTNHVLDLRMALAIISQCQINSIILSSVDLAVILCVMMEEHGIKWPISFIIGTYFYNYDPKTGVMNRLQEMNALEYNRKHEFGIFNPFSGLEQQRKEEQENV